MAWENLGAGVPKILFRRSTDNGTTWSEPVKINDGDGKRDFDFVEEFPTLAVAPDGRIDRRLVRLPQRPGVQGR